MPDPDTQALFEAARGYEVGFYLGYCERLEGQGGTQHHGQLAGSEGLTKGNCEP